MTTPSTPRKEPSAPPAQPVFATPARNATSSRSRAGVTEYQPEDIEQDLQLDLKNTTKCDFDELLKYLLSLLLHEGSTEKKRLDELQEKIEQLQEIRYASESAETTAKENPSCKGDDGTEEEKTLIQERDDILQTVYHECLEAMKPVCEDAQLQEFLEEYCRMNGELKRYAPYTKFCNRALELLSNIDIDNAPLPGPHSLDIRVQVCDLKTMTAKYPGEAEVTTKRKPDVGFTSLIAANDLAGSYVDLITNKPFSHECFSVQSKKPCSWRQYLTGTELKYGKPVMKIFRDTAKEGFHSTSRRVPIKHYYREVDDDTSVAVQAGSKRPLDEADAEELNAKRQRSSTTGTATSSQTGREKVESQSKKMTSYRSRCASYAMEMLSHCLGVHHAIHLLLVDDKLWVWYYDRQGIIQSDGISIVADLSRFLVILFAFQRFTLEDFGVIRSLNPGAVAAHEHPASHSKTKQAAKPIKKANLPLRLDNYYDAGRRLKEVTLKLDEVLSPSPHCLAGRGTAVLAADGKQGNRKGLPMVCKIYYPEVKRSHEGTTLRIIHEIAKINGKEMTKHLPELYFYGDMPQSTTRRVRSMIKRRWKGHRTLRILGFKKLEKITNVKGGDFVKAWLEVVTCHSFLWKNYVEHGDPSLNNAMYDPSLKCGVLTDFDLSLLQWEPRVLGDDRTGTIPFMALDLLSQAYWEGTLKRYYHHELESFIWILLYTFLLYEDAERQTNSHADNWRTSRYDICRYYKQDIVFTDDGLRPVLNTIQLGFTPYRKLAEVLCQLLLRPIQPTVEEVIARLLADQESSDSSPHTKSLAMWEKFARVLGLFEKSNIGKAIKLSDHLDLFKECKPAFEPMTEDVRNDLQRLYGHFRT